MSKPSVQLATRLIDYACSSPNRVSAISSVGGAVAQLRRVSVWCSRPDQLTAHNGPDCSVALVGLAFNASSGLHGERLVRAAAAASTDLDEFAKFVDELTGRYVLFIEDASGLRVVADAAATLPVFYTESGTDPVVAARPSTLASICPVAPNPVVRTFRKDWFARRGITHLPADLTEYVGVRMLTPNVVLRWRDGKAHLDRAFPHEPRVDAAVGDVVSEACQWLSASAEYLPNLGRPIKCSLSGGVDSRLTLAALRAVRSDVTFFTFGGDDNASRDTTAATGLAQALRLRHVVTRSKAERLDVGESEAVLLRSSISEVTRAFFRRKFRLSNDFGFHVRIMAPIYKRVPPWSRWAAYLEREFGDWATRTASMSARDANYDPFDMLYWEHRVGTWQSGVLQSLEHSGDSPMVLFANRALLRCLLRAPLSARRDDSLHEAIVRRLWPSAMDVPFVKNFGRKALVREATEAAYLRAYITSRGIPVSAEPGRRTS